jgi:chromate transporter
MTRQVATNVQPDLHSRQTALVELALLLFKLGFTAMGGPAVHIAMMEEEVVTRRRWMSREAFLDFLGATNLIPGPNSTEMAIHVGRVRAGWPGLLVAGISYILPAALMVTALAWAYVRYGALPQISALLYGVKPVVIVIIAQGAYRLGRSAVKSAWLATLGTLALAAAALGLDPLAVLFGAGALAGIVHLGQKLAEKPASLGVLPAFGAPLTAPPMAFSLSVLFLVMLKIGATLFGGGYVLVSFLRADLVSRLHWLTERQLLDAVAAGQITPGPLFTTATFVGYVLGGTRGAVAATIGIFLPAFVLVAISGPVVPILRRSPAVGAVLDGINVGALALMIAVSAQLAHTAIVDWPTVVIAVPGAVLLFRYRLNSAWLVGGGALTGALVFWARALVK